jgi:hypothetical protein
VGRGSSEENGFVPSSKVASFCNFVVLISGPPSAHGALDRGVPGYLQEIGGQQITLFRQIGAIGSFFFNSLAEG